MAYSALDSLAQTTDLILNPHKYSISVDAKEEITSIREHAISLISLLENFSEKANRLEGKIRDVATEAEDIIESFMWKQIDANYWGLRPSTRVEFEQQLKRTREEIGSIAGDMMDDGLRDSPAAISSSSRPAYTGKNDMVIGLDEELIAIKGRLYGESSKLEVIPILGVGGIGKTTLARYAYDDRLTMEHFNIRSWVTISQDYSAQDTLSCLLDSMKLFDEQMLTHENQITMREKIDKCLKGRRYLIVMDDVWSTKTLYDVTILFPDDNNGSRIMLTTQLSNVATYAVSTRLSDVVSGSPVHDMKFMDEDQCWNLLKQKVFANVNGQGCPSELEDVGKEIARSCGGLPLAIVLVAGVLSKVVETRVSWEEIAKNVNSDGGGQLERILSLSYSYLPHHLRPCFLYMGGFPEDHEVRVSKLIKLWVAEGFPKRINESKSLEEEAEEYLEDLVERSLVLASSRKSNGKIKSCSLHDLVRAFCTRKAQEEKFLVQAANKCVDARCLSITNSNNLNDICGSTIRTILCLQELEASRSGSLDFLGRNKLLRVLDLANDSGRQLPSKIFDLYHLRYLASWNPVPYFIPYLFHLHTLIINLKANQSNKTVLLDIWRMPQLRHLVVPYLDVNPNPADRSTLPLEKLQTLSEVEGPVCSEKFLKMFPNVKKLGLIYHQNIFPRRDYQLYNLARLDQLEKLKVTMRNFSWVGRNPAFPRTLKKMTLSGGGFPWKDMTIVGSLPNLEVLKLINLACDGDIWETTHGEFPQLKFLLIEKSNLHHWITECSHFPRLKCLILRLCPSLSQTSDSIVNFLVKSAKEIQEDQQSNGNNALQVRIVGCLNKSEKTSWKKCYMIGARELEISNSDCSYYWQWKACAESRFSEVAQLIGYYVMDIRVKIKTEMLSSNTTYAAYLVFMLAEVCCGLESTNAVVGFVGDAEKREVVVHLQQGANGDQRQNGRHSVWRNDGWMEVELGTFFNLGVDDEVEAKLTGIGPNMKSGLIVEGIEFRPKKQLRHLDVSYNPADKSTFPLENLQMLSEDTSGQTCYMRCARELWIVWSDNPEYWQWKPCAESRFSEVAELISVCWLDIRIIIMTQMLSSNTTYAAYLVFKLAERCYGLESANAFFRFVSDEDAEESRSVVHLQQRLDAGQNGRAPVSRDDGWMEVEMGSFYNDDDGGEVDARLMGIDGLRWKSGLIIEGIEFRPKAQFDP